MRRKKVELRSKVQECDATEVQQSSKCWLQKNKNSKMKIAFHGAARTVTGSKTPDHIK